MEDEVITEEKIIVVGMGPGANEYLPPISWQKILAADVLIGGRRHLEQFADLEVFKKEITNNLTEISEFIVTNYVNCKIVVLVSGDPGFHSIMEYLTKRIAREKFLVIPGISSVQLAFSRLVLSWQDAKLVSLHGKDISILEKYLTEPKLGLLTDPVNTPQAVARLYWQAGKTNKIFYTCENLSYADEVIQQYETIQLLRETRKINNCVVVVCDA